MTTYIHPRDVEVEKFALIKHVISMQSELALLFSVHVSYEY